MKNLTTYIQESIEAENLQQEIIDEGLKDWIKKAAVTTAVTASLLAPQVAKADVIVAPTDNDSYELAQNFVDKYAANDEDVDVFLTGELSTNQSNAKMKPDMLLYNKLMKQSGIKSTNFNPNDFIKSFKIIKNADGKYSVAFILKAGTLKNNITAMK